MHACVRLCVLGQLVSFTHYMPRSWRGRTATFDVRDEVLQLFQYRIILFAMELLSVVLVPLYMVFMLPMQATRIVEFIQSVTIHIDGIGAVCAYAAFDVQKFGELLQVMTCSSVPHS